VSWWGVALAWGGWAVAAAAALILRRRLVVVADAEHELRGAATAIGLAVEHDLSPLLALELERMHAALEDLAAGRAVRGAPPPGLEAGRLAQVLGNVIANAVEHGVGPVEVSALREGRLVRLVLANEDRPDASAPGVRRGRGLVIAKRAARELGGRVSVERRNGVTRTIVELPGRGAAEPPGGEPRGGDHRHAA
jgi:signal transduction histidine kinase